MNYVQLYNEECRDWRSNTTCLSSQQKAASPPEVPFFTNIKSPFTSPHADHTGASQGSSAHTLPTHAQVPRLRNPVILNHPAVLVLNCWSYIVTAGQLHCIYYLSILDNKSNAMEFNVSFHRWRHLLPDFKIILFNKRTHLNTPFENLDRFQDYPCVLNWGLHHITKSGKTFPEKFDFFFHER